MRDLSSLLPVPLPHLLAILLAVLLLPAALADPLSEILDTAGVHPVGLEADELRREVVSYASHDDEDAFVLAGYLGDGGVALPERPTLWHFDRATEAWTARELELITTAGEDVGICAGSVLAVERYGARLFVRTHLTPSAGCELILDHDLQLEHALFGWVVGGFASGEVIYQHNQVHFAPLRPVELSLFDPAGGRHRALYPPLPPYGALRARHLAERSRALTELGEGWCNRNNHPCSPLPFDEALLGRVVVDERAAAVAFAVALEREPVAAGAEPLELAYVYLGVLGRALPEHRELALAEVPLAAGRPDLSALLTPERLEALFGHR